MSLMNVADHLWSQVLIRAVFLFDYCYSQEFLRSQDRSAGTHLTSITEGLETAKFRSYFDNWPQMVAPRLYEEGREKVAGLPSFTNLIPSKEKKNIYMGIATVAMQFLYIVMII